MGIKISDVKSMNDLLNLYASYDNNDNRKLEVGEIPLDTIRFYDRTGDNALSKWEVMTAVNQIQRAVIFSDLQIREQRTVEENIERIFVSGSVYFWNTVDVREGDLKINATLQGLEWKQGTRLFFHPNGKIAGGQLSKNTVIQGIQWESGLGTWSRISLHENGRISFGIPAKDTMIQGMKLRGATTNEGKHTGVFFYPEGIVKQGFLAEDTYVQGMTFRGDQEIRFHRNGKVEGGTLSMAGQSIMGIKFSGIATFYEDGMIHEALLHEDTVINGVKFKAPTGKEPSPGLYYQMLFFPDGKVCKATLAEDTVLKGIKFKGGEEIAFHMNGNVLQGVLAEDAVIKGVPCKGGARINLTKKGIVFTAHTVLPE